METSSISIRIDKKTKQEAESLFEDLGLNMTTAVTMFLKRSLAYGGIPFEIVRETPNRKTLEAMDEVEYMKKHPDEYKSYSSFGEIMKEVEEDGND